MSLDTFKDWLESSSFFVAETKMYLAHKSGKITVELGRQMGKKYVRESHYVTQLTPSTTQAVLALADSWTTTYGLAGKPKSAIKNAKK